MKSSLELLADRMRARRDRHRLKSPCRGKVCSKCGACCVSWPCKSCARLRAKLTRQAPEPLRKERCRHRDSWLIGGALYEWCYRCGAFRELDKAPDGVQGCVVTSAWCYPVGPEGANPWDAWQKSTDQLKKRLVTERTTRALKRMARQSAEQSEALLEKASQESRRQR
jgi:hypothetical protein